MEIKHLIGWTICKRWRQGEKLVEHLETEPYKFKICKVFNTETDAKTTAHLMNYKLRSKIYFVRKAELRVIEEEP